MFLGHYSGGLGVTKEIGNHGVVDNKFSRCQRVDAFGIAAEFSKGFAHGGKVDDAWDSGEILHHNARWRKLNFGIWFCSLIPIC